MSFFINIVSVGVLVFLVADKISLRRGTPDVAFTAAAVPET